MIACSGLLLNAFSEQDIAAREREAVALAGYALREPVIAPDTETRLASRLKWLAEAAIRNTPATSVHVFRGDNILCQAGVVSAESSKTSALPATRRPILEESALTGQEVYLPDLQILPGKVEFSFLPLNCQSVLIVPTKDMVVVVGTNKAKSMTVEDLGRIRVMAKML